jgi:RNA polymerase sigma-70 factor (ECF subfamily)
MGGRALPAAGQIRLGTSFVQRCRDMNNARLPGVSPVVTPAECDERAKTWMARYRRPLVGFVLPLVNGDVHAAEDVVQETMLRAWQHAPHLSPDGEGSWLHTVARNIAISAHHRRRQARPAETSLDESALPVTEDGLDQVFDAWMIATALDKLSPEHRSVIVALFYQRRSTAEVAQLLAIPEGTVRSRCFYGLRVLRKLLSEQGMTGP